MGKYSVPVWKMAKDILCDLGGTEKWIPLIDIVTGVREKWNQENVNEGTIRCQIYCRCVNCHPSHDQFPDNGNIWKKEPTFITNGEAKYKLFNLERDKEIYINSLYEDGVDISNHHNTQPYLFDNDTISPKGEISFKPLFIKNIIDILESCGKVLGFKTVREFVIPMCRIDLVWQLRLPVKLPHHDENQITIAGFEIETSWRTRKHIKGDIVNLNSLHAPLSVIVQQTSTKDNAQDVYALIENVRNSLNYLGASSIQIWTNEDVIQLAQTLGVEFKSHILKD